MDHRRRSPSSTPSVSSSCTQHPPSQRPSAPSRTDAQVLEDTAELLREIARPGQMASVLDPMLVWLSLSDRTPASPGRATRGVAASRAAAVATPCSCSRLGKRATLLTPISVFLECGQHHSSPLSRGPFNGPVSSVGAGLCANRLAHGHTRPRQSISVVEHMIFGSMDARETSAWWPHDADPALAGWRASVLGDLHEDGMRECHFFLSGWNEAGGELGVEHVLGVPCPWFVE